MIFFLFKPLNIKEQKFVDVPLFEIDAFMMHELSNKGLQTLMTGAKGTRYSNRYTVKGIDFTDNTESYIANMKADFGVYKDDILNLDGNVHYKRNDGLVFKTQKIVYNKKTSIAYVNQSYIAYKGTNKVTGTSLEYNNLLNQLQSTNVVANYNIEENNK